MSDIKQKRDGLIREIIGDEISVQVENIKYAMDKYADLAIAEERKTFDILFRASSSTFDFK